MNPKGDGPFQILERINDNAYRVDLPGEYNVSSTFNVADLSPLDVGDAFDSRTNPFEERGNVIEAPPEHGQGPIQQEEQVANVEVQGNSSQLSLPQGPITRSRAKKLQQALNSHLQSLVSIISEELRGTKSYEAREDQMERNLMKITWREPTSAKAASLEPALKMAGKPC